jgi:hypothetical protein
MASDVTLLIADPNSGAMHWRRWLGMSSIVQALQSVLVRPADHSEQGWDVWGRVTSTEAARIVTESESRYAGGATADEIAAQSRLYPDDRFWWIIEHDY